MKQTCILSGQQFSISEAEQAYCKKNAVPLPRKAPFERLREMLCFRNRVWLYRSTCARSGKSILSAIPPEAGHVVYDIDEWISDSWDAGAFARDFDFSRPFFEQINELYRSVPIPNLAVLRSTMENSDYTNGITGAKNCYLLFGSSFNEDCMFSYCLWRCRSVLESIQCFDSELCYECLDCRNCYNLRYSSHCISCSDSAFLYNCQSCKNCYGCVNLNHQQWCMYNEQLTKVEYHKRLSEIPLSSRQVVTSEKQRFEEYYPQFPIKSYFGKSTQNSVGNYLNNTKNCRNCFFVTESEDVENSIYLVGAKSCFSHAMYGNNSELIYNSLTAGDESYNCRFCAECWPGVRDLEYCIYTGFGSSNCFGCVGLRKGRYSVFNKQYGKDEYFTLADRIRDHMRETGEYGNFFPNWMSPLPYNKSEANYFLPIDKSEALTQGFKWADEEADAQGQGTLLPDDIRDADVSLLQKEFACASTGAKYKLIKPELDFYQAHSIPLPDVAPLERIRSRLSFYNLSPLREASCAKTGVPITTCFDPETRPIYSEDAFQQEFF